MEDKKLTRSETDRMIGGVCGGLAAYLQIDATLVRLGFIVLSMVGGAGVVVYVAMWLVVPRGSRADAAPRDVVKDNVAEGREFAEETARAAREAYQRLRGERSGAPPPPPTEGTPPPTEGTPPPTEGTPPATEGTPPAGGTPPPPTEGTPPPGDDGGPPPPITPPPPTP